MTYTSSLFIGNFQTETEAAQAYNVAMIILYEKNKKLNDVPKPSLDTYETVVYNLKRNGFTKVKSYKEVLKYL